MSPLITAMQNIATNKIIPLFPHLKIDIKKINLTNEQKNSESLDRYCAEQELILIARQIKREIEARTCHIESQLKIITQESQELLDLLELLTDPDTSSKEIMREVNKYAVVTL